MLKKRATAIIIENNNILLIKRVKPNTEYYVFPGGGVEKGETLEEALKREVIEELNLDVKQYKLMFSFKNTSTPKYISKQADNRFIYVFEIKKYSGNPKIGGPEKERMNKENQYHLEWVPVSKLKEVKNLQPQVLVEKLISFLN